MILIKGRVPWLFSVIAWPTSHKHHFLDFIFFVPDPSVLATCLSSFDLFRRFSENIVAQMWYFVKCIYFGLSAYQIRCGYPTRVLGNFLTKSYNYVNLFLFQGWVTLGKYRSSQLLSAPFSWENRSRPRWQPAAVAEGPEGDRRDHSCSKLFSKMCKQDVCWDTDILFIVSLEIFNVTSGAEMVSQIWGFATFLW